MSREILILVSAHVDQITPFSLFTNTMVNGDKRKKWLLTSPVARAAKLSTVLGTVFPNSPMTTLPTSSSPILMSKKTY